MGNFFLDHMKKWVGIILCFVTLTLPGCEFGKEPTKAADGLNLHALIGVVRASKNGDDLERRLNIAGGINNLDLDTNGKVDFLQVNEFGGGGDFRGYALVADLGGGNTQEVATVQVHQGAHEAVFQVHGNEQIYGENVYVTNRLQHHEMSAAPFLIWALAPRPVYVRPLFDGYPTWYQPPVVVPRQQYVTKTRVITRTITVTKPQVPAVQTPPTVVNPYAGRTSETIKAPLAKPTETQKQFQVRPENKPVATGGFGLGRRKEPEQQNLPVSPTQPHSSSNPDAGRVEQGFRPRDDLRQVPSPSERTETLRHFEIRPENAPVSQGGFGNRRRQHEEERPIMETPPQLAPVQRERERPRSIAPSVPQSSPRETQKQFESRDPQRPVATGGFGSGSGRQQTPTMSPSSSSSNSGGSRSSSSPPSSSSSSSSRSSGSSSNSSSSTPKR